MGNRAALRRDVLYLIVIAILLTGAIWSFAGAQTPGTWQLVVDTDEEKRFVLVTDDLEPTPTPEPDPTPTPESEPTATPEPDNGHDHACAVSADRWHPPVVDGCVVGHEHGDPPPQWADDWSLEHFGHPVIYGGVEATPGENDMKHEAFKGYSFTSIQPNGVTVDLFVRLHMQSNPHGRSGRWHSYEVYARDEAGHISFWQGWADFGQVPEERFGFDEHTIQSVLDISSHYVISSPPGYSERERWFSAQHNADWSWVITLYIADFTTHFLRDEFDDPMNMETWALTGEYGLDRRMRMHWSPGEVDPRGWFCAEHTGAITAVNVSGPDACGDDLPQHIAPTMPGIHSASYLNVWDGPVELPN